MTMTAAPASPAEQTKEYVELLGLLREAATLNSVGALLSWDQETLMPPRAAAFRAQQLSTMSKLAHERRTDPRIGELLAACENNSDIQEDALAHANIREARRDYDRAVKLPSELIVQMAETNSMGMEAWKEARAKSDYALFKPWLEKQVDLNRRKAECYGVPAGGELYDALMEDFEPGMLSAEVDRLFVPFRAALTPLIAAIADAPKRPSDAVQRIQTDIEKQKELNRFVAGAVGFDYQGGILAVSTHPFSESVAPGDTRMTTRYSTTNFPEAISTTLHESGHSIYEQNQPKAERFGQPLAEAISLGIHESQSRMLENQMGRSRAFWEWALPHAKRILGSGASAATVDDVFGAINIVRPHFIRVESDEVTYNLHIMLRFDLERAMIRGDLSPADLPGAWNERMKNDLGLSVTDDAQGCLQDVHWSMGAIGYFATYSLGNLYAGQFWDKINQDIPDLEAQFSRGEFSGLIGWLSENIHQHGRRYSAPELCRRITGKELSHESLMSYLKAKLHPLYGL